MSSKPRKTVAEGMVGKRLSHTDLTAIPEPVAAGVPVGDPF